MCRYRISPRCKYDISVDKKIKYLMDQEDISEMIVMEDVENDYTSFSISGTMLRSNKYLYPAAGGFDLGCGVGCFFTDIPVVNINYENLIYKNSLYGLRRRRFSLYSNVDELNSIFKSDFEEAMLGDVVTGNHFVELRDYNNKIAVLVHSGVTEDMKWQYAGHFIAIVKQTCPHILESDNSYRMRLDKDSKEAEIILEISKDANLFSKINRKYIAEQVTKKLNGTIISEIDCSHEFIERYDNDIIHCFGVQKYQKIEDIDKAIILSGPSEDNYIVTRVGDNKFLNHGTPLIDVNEDGKRRYAALEDSMKDGQIKDYRIEGACKPLCGCKKGTNKYEYRIF